MIITLSLFFCLIFSQSKIVDENDNEKNLIYQYLIIDSENDSYYLNEYNHLLNNQIFELISQKSEQNNLSDFISSILSYLDCNKPKEKDELTLYTSTNNRCLFAKTAINIYSNLYKDNKISSYKDLLSFVNINNNLDEPYDDLISIEPLNDNFQVNDSLIPTAFSKVIYKKGIFQLRRSDYIIDEENYHDFYTDIGSQFINNFEDNLNNIFKEIKSISKFRIDDNELYYRYKYAKKILTRSLLLIEMFVHYEELIKDFDYNTVPNYINTELLNKNFNKFTGKNNNFNIFVLFMNIRELLASPIFDYIEK